MVVGHHVLDGIGAGAHGDARVKVAGIHVDDAAVGVAQVVHQRRQRLLGGDGQHLAVSLDGVDHGVGGRAIVDLQQMLQALLHRRAVHIAAAGELHAVPQGDGPGQVAVVLPGRRQPWLQLRMQAQPL